MNIVTLICIVIITISVLSTIYIVYNCLKVMKTLGVYDVGGWVKEIIQSLVFIVLFSIIISFATEILLKYRHRPHVKFELSE